MRYKIFVQKGYISWYKNNKLHRLYEPAWEDEDGSKWWLKNGRYHRLDGPAVESMGDKKLWYIYGVNYTEEEFNKKIQSGKK